MKTWGAFGLGVGLGLAVLLTLLLFLQRKDNRALQTANERLGLQLRDLDQRLSNTVAALKIAEQATADAVAMASEAKAKAASIAAASTAQPVSAADSSTTNNVPRPFQASTFLGDKFVGLSWVLPTNVRRDAKTGRVWSDQAVRLPEEARGALTAYVTNVVEREVPGLPTQYVEQNYYVNRQPYYWWPVSTIPSPPKPPTPMPMPKPVDPDNFPPLLPPGKPIPPPSGKPGIFVPPGLR